MTSLLLKMAQAAVNDETLFAAYIQQYATKKSISWNEVAYNLKIGQEQLAKLALCSRPQPALYTSGLLQVADYVGMDHFILKSFIAEVEGRKVVPVNKATRPPKQVYKAHPGRRSWNMMGFLPKRVSWAVGAVILLLVIIGAFVLTQPKPAIAATLVVNEGQATIIQTAARSDSQLVIHSTDEAQAVRAGDRIMVPASATAQLLFIDGSIVELTAGTELDVEELVIDDANYRVHLRVLAGRALSRVVTVLGTGDRFDVSTPSSTASVRGTIFTVAYISETETYISCDEGKVEVFLKDQEPQIVEAGMEVTAVVGQPLNVKSQQGIEIIESPAGTSPTTIQSPAEEPQAAPDNNTESGPVELLPILNGPDGVGPVYNDPTLVATGATADEEPITPGAQPDPTPTVTPPPPPVTPEPPEPEPMVTICHQPGTPAEQTLEVAESAVQGHLDHGDTLGECPAPVNTPDGSGGNSGGNGGGDGSGLNGGGNGNGNNGGGNSGDKTKTK